ncbi:hypothetical protein L1887_23288 [Cichorium endivia]|nr:hypothetical protein L1887_23288 [Cichorium endivia]
MRTRFLTDFFSFSDASQSLQTLDFLRFPPPQLPSPDLFNFDNLSCFDQVTSLNISPEVERFSVNESLSKFFSDVLPQYINAEIDQQIARTVTSEENFDGNFDGAANTVSTLVEFETPELHLSLKDSSFLHEEKMQIFFEVADEVNLDLVDYSLEVEQLLDIQKSIFHIEDYHVEFQEEHKPDFFDNVSLVQAQISSNLRTFPLLEIDETSLGINTYIIEDKHIIFDSNEPQQWMQKVELTFDVNEQIFSMEFNILEHLLNHPPVPCHQFEVPCVNFSTDDIINAIEYCEQIFSEYLAFEPLKFFDLNTSHFSEVFSDTEIISEVEDYEQMFGDTTLSTFNGLIVKHELVLRDNSFKSLPVPIFSDHEKILSVQDIVEEVLLKLKLQSSSTSDDIYLDWQLLEEDISSHNILKMFEDVDTYRVDADMESCASQMSILEFVLFDACSNELKCQEKTEVLKIEMSGNLMDSVCNDGMASSKLDDICKKMESGKVLVDNKVNRDHELVESMSEFNDLDFFLNSLEGNFVKKQKATDEKLEMDYALPVVSAKSTIETNDNSKKQSLEIEFHSEGDFHSTSILNKTSNKSELLHSAPVEENNITASLEATNEAITSSFHPQIPKLPSAMDPNKINTNTPSFPNAIIIVNTQNVDTEMIISRRTTYQKILNMEKQGVQVVERDLNLPVDIIISASVCLLLYDIKNITTKTSSSDTQSSSFISSCVENIAANILTSLSFAFTSCILIFEGEIGFLCGIMESSDELYAAAASLGIDLQLFCSYSCDTTDEIIVNCITHAAKSTKGLYPKMPESETLAESFLSKFPSLNPLSAHAILSSGPLLDFLEMPHQQRVCTVKKYLVPEASILLFTALCRYGEREDSKSGMTDCCSSVSSGHDSGNCCPKVDHESKKRKYIPMPMDSLFPFEKINDVTWDTPKTDMDFDEILYSRSDHNFSGQTKHNSKSLQEGYKGQVIDIDDDDDVAGEDFSFGQTVSFPIETRSAPENYGDRKRLSYDWCSLPSFPTAAEITLNSQTDLMENVAPLEMSSIVNSPMNFFKEKGQYCNNGGTGTPLSKAISSAKPQKGSPWTIDFLNRIKEKSRMRQQSLPLISSAPCFGHSGNSSKFRKRKSPSILDFYRYKRNSATQNIEHKGQNGHMTHIQPSNSTKAVKSSPLPQTWTPIDKRAKRKLTFATEGNKGQSKLIWSDKTNQTLNKRL